MQRQAMLKKVSAFILQITCAHPVRVAIDGVDASGKTTFANQLAEVLKKSSRQVIRASVDNFHNPEQIRHSKGSLSPEGFYQDSYNYPALIENLLRPLGPNGNRQYCTAVYNYRLDQPIDSAFKTALENAILLIDGIFLLRPLLLPYWDLTIYLDADFKNTVLRGVTRDTALFGSAEAAAARYRERYVPGQQHYHQHARPLDKADILIDNNKLEAPEIIRMPKSNNNFPQ